MASLVYGAGAFPPGECPAGHDPPDDPSERVEQTSIASAEFDPYDRVWSQNDDLTLTAASPVIQRAALLMMPLGALPATPTHGLDIVRIKRALPSQRLRIITEELKRAWSPLLDPGLMRMGEVTLSSPWTGEWQVKIVDLLTREDATLTGDAGSE